MLALYDCHTCAEAVDTSWIGIPEQLKMQHIALTGLKELALKIGAFASNILMSVQGSEVVLSPFISNCLYEAAKQCIWYIRETGNPELGPLVTGLTEALQAVGTHWSVAGMLYPLSSSPD